MDNTKIIIQYRNRKEETEYVSSYGVYEGCLKLYHRYKDTRFIPLDLIKEWRVVD